MSSLAPSPAAALTVRLLTSPWSRLALLVVLLACAAGTVALYEPQRLLSDGRPAAGALAVVVFALAYGACTTAFVPRPVLNLAAGAVFGAQLGTVAAVAGTVVGAGCAFGLGRLLGRDALRPLLRRGRWLEAADRQLSRHGFRSMLAIRLLPGVPFVAANYGASVTDMRWRSFLCATALGCVPNTAAYAVAGASATTPASPAFLGALAVITLPAAGAALFAWRRRRRAVRPLRAEAV